MSVVSCTKVESHARQAAGHDQAAVLIQGRDHLEEQIGLFPVHRQVTYLVDEVVIDALGWLHDNSAVVRFGRKYSAVWTLAGTPAAPSPRGGEAEGTPGLCVYS